MTTISSTLPGLEARPQGSPAGRQAVKDLATSLKSGDLEGARQAYVQVVRHAPEGATWKPDSAFAEMGRALKAGDVEAAREVAKQALGAWADRPRTVAPPGPGPAEPMAQPSTTGGTAGTLLNVVA